MFKLIKMFLREKYNYEDEKINEIIKNCGKEYKLGQLYQIAMLCLVEELDKVQKEVF